MILKVIMIGDSSAGKSSILYRYIDNKFIEDSMKTVGCDFKTKSIDISGNNVKLQIWDTGGTEKEHEIVRSFYRNADCAIFAFDLTHECSFDTAICYYKEFIQDRGPLPVVLLGNKCDLNQKDYFIIEKLEQFQKEYGVKYFEVSAKENINIEESFRFIANNAFSYKYRVFH